MLETIFERNSVASDWESTGRASPRADFVPGDWDQSLSSSPLENERGPGAPFTQTSSCACLNIIACKSSIWGKVSKAPNAVWIIFNQNHEGMPRWRRIAVAIEGPARWCSRSEDHRFRSGFCSPRLADRQGNLHKFSCSDLASLVAFCDPWSQYRGVLPSWGKGLERTWTGSKWWSPIEVAYHHSPEIH